MTSLSGAARLPGCVYLSVPRVPSMMQQSYMHTLWSALKFFLMDWWPISGRDDARYPYITFTYAMSLAGAIYMNKTSLIRLD